MARKVLNLGRPAAAATRAPASPSSSSASGSEDDAPTPQKRTQAPAGDSEQSATEQSDSDDEEFEIPPGFESVQGSSTITRESILSGDKELWFFKLPKNVDASALANTSFKLPNPADMACAAVATIQKDGKTYQLQTEDVILTNQLVNAFPSAKERRKFTLGKPFTRCFSLVEDRKELKRSVPSGDAHEEASLEVETTPKKKSKSSKNKSVDASAATAETSKPLKKSKSKK